MRESKLFQHGAMNTTFWLRFAANPDSPLPGIARACHDRLDELESQLSRFRGGSDVHQINSMRTGETLIIGEACDACLRLAARVGGDTGGLFDVTLGRRIEHFKAGKSGPPPRLGGRLILDPKRPMVTCEEAGREIDLGGIGKGFALDDLGRILTDWGISDALLAAGASTHLALGAADWPLLLLTDNDQREVRLATAAMSVSGTAVLGSHIASPLEIEPDPPIYAFKRIWCVAATAALADAWTTAAMLMTPEEIPEVARDCPYVESVVAETPDGTLRRLY